MPPTLYQKGKVIPPKGADQELVDYYKNTLPVTIISDWIKKRMPEYGAPLGRSLNDRVLLVEAKTGSGKSSAMPVELYRILRGPDKKEYYGPGVLVTEPRVLTAIAIPSEDIVGSDWAPDMIMGETIGYSTGSSKEKVRSGLLYVTTGTLLQQLRSTPYEKFISMYRFIVLDEIHVRSLDLDITMMLLKKLLTEMIGHKDCPFVILTSATFDANKFAKYFGIDIETNIISVAGQSQPISDNFLEHDSNDVFKSIADTVRLIHEDKVNYMKQGENDILIFVPGAGEMKKVYALLVQMNVEFINQKKKCYAILKIDRQAVSMNSRDVSLVYANYDKLTVNMEGEFDRMGENKAYRRIIISTEVAETGLTIPTLGHVIDIGVARGIEHYPPMNIEGLLTKCCPKTKITQRRGRAGRKFPGHYYGMYTEETYNMLTPRELPNIITDDISSVVLDILLQQDDCFDVNKIDMLDVPPIDSLKESIEMNITLGYIDSNYGECFKSTEMGNMVRNLRYSKPEEFRCILASYVHDVATIDIISIIAMGGKEAPRLRKVNIKEVVKESLPTFFFKSYDYYEVFTQITMDDFIRDLFILSSFENILYKGIESADKWCKDMKLDFNVMLNVVGRKYEIMDDIIKAGLDPFYCKDKKIADSKKTSYLDRVRGIKRCMYDGYILNLIHHDKATKSYKNRFGFNVKAIFNRDNGYPDYILTDRIMIKDNSSSVNYSLDINTERISVLDGYISIDSDYLGLRCNDNNINRSKVSIDSYYDILSLLDTTKLLASNNPKLADYIS